MAINLKYKCIAKVFTYLNITQSYINSKKSLRIGRVHTKKLAGQMVKSKVVFASCQKNLYISSYKNTYK